MEEQARKQLINERRKNVKSERIKQRKITSDERRYEYVLNKQRK